MKESKNYTERRLHERSSVQNFVVGILNSGRSVTIGSVSNISMGGARCTYNELRMAPDDGPFHSIDLIADGHYLVDLPCENAWDVKVETESYSKLTDLRECGVQFGELTPNQIFLLRSFINHCASLRVNGITPDVHINYS